MQAGTGTELLAAPVPTRAPAGRDWSELPVDALSWVFAKLGVVDILMGPGLVCRSWLLAAGLPELWRSVDMANDEPVGKMGCDALRAMAKVAVNRSGGQLEVFVGKGFVNDELLKYIGDSASSLKRLRLINCYDVSNEGLAEAITKFPRLDELELSNCLNVYERYVFETVGNSCPQLTCFRRCQHTAYMSHDHREAMGIAAMTKLLCLQLFGNNLTNGILIAILDNCPHLEALDIRRCFSIKMDNTLRAKCAGIKALRLPEDSVDDYEHNDELSFFDSDADNDYGDRMDYGFDVVTSEDDYYDNDYMFMHQSDESD